VIITAAAAYPLRDAVLVAYQARSASSPNGAYVPGIAALAVTVEAGNKLYWAWCARQDGRGAPIVTALTAAPDHRPLIGKCAMDLEEHPPGGGGGVDRLFMHDQLHAGCLQFTERVEQTQKRAPEPIECRGHHHIEPPS
jgi:hypothetical protein